MKQKVRYMSRGMSNMVFHPTFGFPHSSKLKMCCVTARKRNADMENKQ